MEKNIELMSPVGNYESLIAAINSGADSIYFGVEQLNMRAKSANNFTIKDIDKITKICKENKIECFLTLNTIMYNHDLNLMKKICNKAKKSNVNAIIASDVSAMMYANSIGLNVHCSTQTNVSNIESVKFYSKFVDVIVLARELTLSQIKEICKEIKDQNIKGPSGNLVKIEIFVHGALCVAVSGKCYMSLATYNASANRGACLQNCRRSYKVTDEETGDELIIDNKYIMSPKDLCTIGFLDKILDSGVSILKIEGRARSPEYVYTVTRVYKEAIKSYYEGSYTKEKIELWTKELESVFNRGFWHGGYYLGKKLGEWSGAYGSKATKDKIFVGVASNYFAKINVCEFFLQAGSIKIGDGIIIIGPTTGVIETKVESLRKNNSNTGIVSAQKGDYISIPLNKKIRKNDKLYVLKNK